MSPLPDELIRGATRIAAHLVERGETVAVAESSAGGLISAALLSVPGASAYYLGGAVVYTGAARVFVATDAVPPAAGMRGATEGYAGYLARSITAQLGATWGVAETGATGPAPNPYGDPPGHAWVAVAGGPAGRSGISSDGGVTAERVATGDDDRQANMVAFAAAALALLERSVSA